MENKINTRKLEFKKNLSDLKINKDLNQLKKLILKINSLQKNYIKINKNNDYDLYSHIIPYENTIQNIYNINYYLNASIIEFENIRFIAAMYPKQKYYQRFLDFIGKSKISVIVSFHVEDSDFLDFYKFNKKCDENGIYEIREYIFGNKILYRIIMNTWKDMDVPDYNEFSMFYKVFLDIISKFQKCEVLVHCKAGVGRTGTFILYHMLKKCKNVELSDILDGFLHLRAHRPYMVYNEAQLEFIINNFLK